VPIGSARKEREFLQFFSMLTKDVPKTEKTVCAFSKNKKRQHRTFCEGQMRKAYRISSGVIARCLGQEEESSGIRFALLE
jgi:hypothetical protein